MSLVVLIPCKDLDRGKSRLARCLAPRARRALCEFFLCRTLDVATKAFDPAWVRVVTGDPRVAALAAEFRVAAIADGGADINGALARGRSRVLTENGDCAALILPIDLPLATPAALARLAEARDDAVIVPDEATAGTNVLRLGRRALRRFRFAYGPQSFRRHRAEARALGLSLRTVHDPVLKFDIDGPDEYRRWIASA
jgi:2-phospho-L-lactate/phosphoenolpyruvate guanylyltransferase